IIVLETSRENLKSFPPYWAVLASGYYQSGDINKALSALGEFELLMENNPIFKKNPYVLQAAKDKISILMKNDNPLEHKDEILKYIDIVKKNTTNVTEELDNLNYYLVPIYISLNDFGGVNSCLNYLKSRELLTENSRLVNQVKLLQPEVYSNTEISACLEKTISSIDFGFSEHNNSTLTPIMLNELKNSGNVFFWAKSEFDIKPNMVFSIDGKSGMESHTVETRNFGEYKVCVISDFTWNDLALKPFFTIVSDGFMANFQTSVDQISNTEYFQSFETTNITNALEALGVSTDSYRQKTNLGSAVKGLKGFGKSLADVDMSSAKALFGGLGKKLAGGAKDAADALKNNGVQELNHLTITIIAINKNGTVNNVQ
ncbi:MAG: hypothetical protein HUK25_05130, partial [Treponema sp.]|nr:hypothetical protein [Treponema sp.]